MNTKSAIQAMLDGKKVRPVDESVAYFEHFYFDGVGFIDHNKDYFDFNYWMTNHTDWEIYEEPKPKKTVLIEKWLLEGKVLTQKEKYLHIVETSNINRYIKTWADYKKVKLLDTYEVEL